MLKVEIPYTYTYIVIAYATLQYPSHLLTYFSCMDTWIEYLNPEFYDSVRFAPTTTWSDPLCRINSHTDVESSSYVNMFSIFWGIRIMHTAYIESRLKTTEAVFIAVYWLCLLDNLKFSLNSESENGYEASVTQQSSNELHWLSIPYQTIFCWFLLQIHVYM